MYDSLRDGLHYVIHNEQNSLLKRRVFLLIDSRFRCTVRDIVAAIKELMNHTLPWLGKLGIETDSI